MVRISLSDEQVQALLEGESAELVDQNGRVIARSRDLEFASERVRPNLLTTEEAKRHFETLIDSKRTS